MKASHIKIQYPEDYKKMEIVLTLDKTQQNIVKLAKCKEIIEKGKLLKVDIKQLRNKRSLDANAYCFVLCQKIAEIIGNTKEFVYKQAIRQVGQFEIVPIRDDAVARWIEAWESKGLGWQSEIMRDSKLEGYTTTINYYGSSVYNGYEMGLLIDELIYQSKELDIETAPPHEIDALKKAWGERRVSHE